MKSLFASQSDSPTLIRTPVYKSLDCMPSWAKVFKMSLVWKIINSKYINKGGFGLSLRYVR